MTDYYSGTYLLDYVDYSNAVAVMRHVETVMLPQPIYPWSFDDDSMVFVHQAVLNFVLELTVNGWTEKKMKNVKKKKTKKSVK